MSVSVFEHPVLSALLGDEPVAAHFSVSAEIQAMLRFEAALAHCEEAAGVIPEGSSDRIAEACKQFTPDMHAMKQATVRDGVCVPEMVRQLRATLDPDIKQFFHFGATSQDVVDTALVLRLKPVLAELEARIAVVLEHIASADERFGHRPLTAHTRMQIAIPITVGDKLAAWRRPLQELATGLDRIRGLVLKLQFGGAAGTLDQLGEKSPAVLAQLAKALDLGDCGCWHTDRTSLAELAGWLSQVTGVLGKVGQDVALMAQNEVGAVKLSGGGTSSAMAHKHNPVSAEVLVALAGFNATLVGGMHRALVHENERSGAAWTMEWMLLPQMAVASAASLRTAIRMVGSIEDLGNRDHGGPRT
ncbi:MAG: 3-carboxy-cis,cis-muconate cycloisomerase [Pseudomonadota bacterium]